MGNSFDHVHAAGVTDYIVDVVEDTIERVVPPGVLPYVKLGLGAFAGYKLYKATRLYISFREAAKQEGADIGPLTVTQKLALVGVGGWVVWKVNGIYVAFNGNETKIIGGGDGGGVVLGTGFYGRDP